MELTVEEVAAAVGGTAHYPDGRAEGVSVDGATQDSRAAAAGQLFVPLIADRDGHDFIVAAVAAGAGAYLTSAGAIAESVPHIDVDDTAKALTRLGQACRWRSSATVVGITGSVGKTTTKDLMVAACSPGRIVFANPRSFNNEIGVPLTLVNAPTDADVLIIEMGARDIGHIARLCDIARPTIGVVTTIGAAHTEIFGSVAQIAEAKGELIEALPPDGLAVLNAGQPDVMRMARRTTAESVSFGVGGDVTATDISMGTRRSPLEPNFTANTPWGKARVELGAKGRHNVDNALAALAVAGWIGTPVEESAAALATPQLSPLRMEVTTLPGGATLINDAYNANPMSMRAALDSLAELDLPGGSGTRRIAVLGTMAELAEGGLDEHSAVAAHATELGIELIAYRTDAYGVDAAQSPEEAIERIGPLQATSGVLVKASRVARLEEVVALLERSPDV